MKKNDQRIVQLETTLKTSKCHNCKNPMILVKAEFKQNEVRGIIYCGLCDELSGATFYHVK